ARRIAFLSVFPAHAYVIGRADRQGGPAPAEIFQPGLETFSAGLEGCAVGIAGGVRCVTGIALMGFLGHNASASWIAPQPGSGDILPAVVLCTRGRRCPIKSLH